MKPSWSCPQCGGSSVADKMDGEFRLCAGCGCWYHVEERAHGAVATRIVGTPEEWLRANGRDFPPRGDSYELLDGTRIFELTRDAVREAVAAWRLHAPKALEAVPSEDELDAMARAILQARFAMLRGKIGPAMASPFVRQMRVVCGWCGLILKPGHAPQSTGICDKCKAKHFPPARVTVAVEGDAEVRVKTSPAEGEAGEFLRGSRHS
jgi:hypothetical protein